MGERLGRRLRFRGSDDRSLRDRDFLDSGSDERRSRTGGRSIAAGLGLLRCPVAPDTAGALALLKRRLAALLSPDLPPILTDKESVWECGYCPLKDTCEQLHGGPVGRDQFGDGEA